MDSKMRMNSLSVWRRSFRYRLVACLSVALAFQAALAPVAAASMNCNGVADSYRGASPSASQPQPQPQTTSNQPALPSIGDPARTLEATVAGETIPELWTPRAAMVLDTNPPANAQTLFDGDDVTGFTTAAGQTGAVRLDLGATRRVMSVGVHGVGQAQFAIYAEDNGVRRLIGTKGGTAVELMSGRWAQVALPSPTETSALVVQWTGSRSKSATLTELALWVAGRPHQALAEAAVADRLATALPDNAVATTAVPWNAAVARVTAQGPVLATFSVTLDRDPMLGRAFLMYELEKKAHWTGAARSINGHVVRGGYRANAKGLGGVQVEEINPAWLKRGNNTISFQPTLIEDGLGYEIRNMRIVSVPRGVESAASTTGTSSAPGAAARSAIADGDLSTGVGGPGMHSTTLPSSEGREPAFLSFYLDKPTRGTMTVTSSAERTRRRGELRVDLDGRPAGWQAVPIAGVLPPAAELRLRVQGDRESAGQISEARIVSFPTLASSAEVTVSYPLHGECQEHKTYVRGFASRTAAGKRPQFLVDGQPRSTQIDSDGSFEMEVAEPAAVKGKPWSVRLDVVDDSGGHATRNVPVDVCVEPAKGGVSSPIVDEGAPYGVVVSAHKASTLSFANAKIEIPAGAVQADTRVTMRALDRGQLHPMPAEMDNVIGSSGGALRFGPHGLKFKRPVRVTLPVDPARLPPGMTAGDVQIYFFDEAASKWAPLPQLRTARDRVVAETTHFTDFVAVTVRTPEHPDMQQFNPNTMKNMKVGDPTAGITLIQPPEPNASGSARLSYPIETPPGRNGIGPNLALTYDSERVNSNGWLGVGWDLRMSSIELDTRFGVPKYDGTEVYTLDGAMLTATSPAGTYLRRVEGAFDLIKRAGTGPTTYSWTVTDKSGTVYTYGTSASSRLADLRSTPGGNIFRWYLEKVTDTYGNYMTITYVHDTFTQGTSPNVETFDDVYPSAIDYTAGPGVAAAYHVQFVLDGTRSDKIINARSGFLVETRQRLQDVKVKLGTTLVRQYRFEYQPIPATDPMQKTLLSAVALWGVEDNASSELYRHTFAYNRPPDSSEIFSAQQPWGHFWQNSPTGGQVPRSDNGLSHSADSLGGGSVTVGVGFPVVSATGSFGMDSGGSNTNLAFVPVTGEGLPDQVDVNGLVSVNVPPSRLPLPIDTGDLFNTASLVGLPSLGESGRSGWTAGGNISALQGVFGLGVSYARHVSTDTPIITDINGDGFPDIVYGEDGNVGAYINDGKNNFARQAWSGYSLTNSPFSTADRVAQASTASAFFHTDPLIRWVAPFTGMATINFTAAAGGPTRGPSGALRADGYETRVELFVTGDPTRTLTIGASDSTPHSLEPTPNYRKMITAGDRVYLRLATPGADAINQDVGITGSIVYDTPATPPGRLATDLEPYGPSRYSFNYSSDKDHKMTGQPRTAWHLDYDGDISVSRCFSPRGTLPDDVTVSLVVRDKLGNQVKRFDKTAFAKDVPPEGATFCFDTSSLPPSSANPDLSVISNVSAGQNVGFEITSDTRVDPERIDLDTSMLYTRLCRPGRGGSVCIVPQFNQVTGVTTFPGDPWPAFPIKNQSSVYVPYFSGYVWQTYNGTTTTPQPTVSYPAPSTSLTVAGTFTLTAPLPGDVLLLVQGVNKLHRKVRIPAGTSGTFGLPGSCTSGPLVCSGPPGPVTVQANEPIFFTIYSPTASTPTAITNSLTWNPSVNSSAVASSFINTAILDPRYDNNHGSDRDPMSGGYHQWFFADWNDSIQWNEGLTGRTSVAPQNSDAIVPAVPLFDGDDPFWAGRGGTQISDEGVTIGRLGNPIASAADGNGAAGLRIADTWNLDVNMSGTGLNFGVNGGDSTTQVDFFDVNGDRFPDSVTNGGVQYNDGVSAFPHDYPPIWRSAVPVSCGGR